ncbi:hypothetical protein GCM10011383_03470 [Hymenobacter cavernae]|uniref:Uncharacterized protein n=1 Tax=Hymenobacter cavernae TaxID=2044852 RepID=A0ABQ1TIM1_9BACT|nr:hypothetical protein GCM10011383_03470 [Hymenobacter cavernae]
MPVCPGVYGAFGWHPPIDCAVTHVAQKSVPRRAARVLTSANVSTRALLATRENLGHNFVQSENGPDMPWQAFGNP